MLFYDQIRLYIIKYQIDNKQMSKYFGGELLAKSEYHDRHITANQYF